MITELPEGRAGIKRLLAKYGADAVRCAPVLPLDLVEEIIKSGECYTLRQLAVSGTDLILLGYPPGREIGVMLNKLLLHVIERPDDNVREILLSVIEKSTAKESPFAKQREE